MSLGVEESSQFLRMCLGGHHRADDGTLLDIDDDDDFWSAQDDDSEEFGECAEFFALADSDGEEDEDLDLEDAYNFDPEICAELLKRNSFTMEELTEKFQESMAQALERRLNIECCTADVEERPDCQGDLVGRMTPPKTQPGCMTPPEEVLTHPGPDEQTVAEKLEKVQHRARRSSAIKRKSIQEAVSKAASRHRRSLLTKVFEKTEEGTLASPESNATIDLAVQTAQKRHRLSILKAAETLDAASLDNEDDATVSKKFQMVHKAMEEARTRHRRSIASAVQNMTAVIAEQPFKQVSGMSAEAMPFHPEHCIQQRIQSAIAAAHRRHQQKKQHEFHPPSIQNLHGQSSGLVCWQANMNYNNHQSQVPGEAMWNGGSTYQQPWLSGASGCEQAWSAALVYA